MEQKPATHEQLITGEILKRLLVEKDIIIGAAKASTDPVITAFLASYEFAFELHEAHLVIAERHARYGIMHIFQFHHELCQKAKRIAIHQLYQLDQLLFAAKEPQTH